jgi:hypothetical protein
MGTWLRLYGPALLAWVLFASRALHSYWHPPDSARRLLGIILLALAVSLTVLTPAAYMAVGQVTGIPNVARLLGHASMLVAAWSAQSLLRLLHTHSPQPAGGPHPLRHALGIGAGLAVMTCLFALATTPVNDVRFAARYAGAPWVLEYWLVYLLCLAPAYCNISRFAFRYARLSTTPLLRLGLHLIAVAAMVGLAYHVHKAFLFAGHRFTFPYLPAAPSRLLDALLPLIGHVLILVGATLPTWGARLGLPTMLDWLHRYRTYQALRPLWLALYRADPKIALAPPAPALVDLLTPRDLGLRLYRRVIEIRDGRMALQPYCDPSVAAAARAEAAQTGVTGQTLEALVEAATLSAALKVKTRGGTVVSGQPLTLIPGGEDLDSDIAFLRDVARAYRRGPAVSAT